MITVLFVCHPPEIKVTQLIDHDVEAGRALITEQQRSGRRLIGKQLTMPQEFGPLIEGIMQNTPGIEDVIVSVHTHDDLGFATANALAGIQFGARQAEVTVNGIGERAGNTSLEEVVMALEVLYGYRTRIKKEEIYHLATLVSRWRITCDEPADPRGMRQHVAALGRSFVHFFHLHGR